MMRAEYIYGPCQRRAARRWHARNAEYIALARAAAEAPPLARNTLILEAFCFSPGISPRDDDRDIGERMPVYLESMKRGVILFDE